VFLIENFVTREEEREFIEANNNNDNNTKKKKNEEEEGETSSRENGEKDYFKSGWKSLSKRRVRHYGKKFDYDTRDAANDAEEKIPELLDVDVRKRLEALVSVVADAESTTTEEKGGEEKSSNDFSFTRQNANDDAWTEDERRQISEAIQKVIAFDQVTVNEYPPGCGIAPHVDTHSAFTGTILSLLGRSMRHGISPPEPPKRRRLFYLSYRERYRRPAKRERDDDISSPRARVASAISPHSHRFCSVQSPALHSKTKVRSDD
jgi:hypothetical protein